MGKVKEGGSKEVALLSASFPEGRHRLEAARRESAMREEEEEEE